eukprot:CAMPEP_0177733714 /NCGR_PEP_ID=MMETSP0484_2-20121128/23836_1 /TAXON_ID=354590 /ORGANISM="Rhodomonas lens, Strain RHODO" /LENGTH=50 /DNA_ID=CAMNT_0019247121 /DNA_START=77 /DNA_END=225 /DNA_ORIENTATION=+
MEAEGSTPPSPFLIPSLTLASPSPHHLTLAIASHSPCPGSFSFPHDSVAL